MSIQADWLSIYLAVIGTIISALLAYLSYSLNRQTQRASMQRSIEELYDEMIRYRSAHPEVMKLCYRWNNDSFAAVYRQNNREEIHWVTYYNYAELISGLLNAILYGRKTRLLDKLAYANHYEPLVKLLVTEHFPYFSSVLQGPYLSSFIKDFIHDLKNEGWDFAEKHRRLIRSASQTELQSPAKSRKERLKREA